MHDRRIEEHIEREADNPIREANWRRNIADPDIYLERLTWPNCSAGVDRPQGGRRVSGRICIEPGWQRRQRPSCPDETAVLAAREAATKTLRTRKRIQLVLLRIIGDLSNVARRTRPRPSSRQGTGVSAQRPTRVVRASRLRQSRRRHRLAAAVIRAAVAGLSRPWLSRTASLFVLELTSRSLLETPWVQASALVSRSQ